MLNMFILNYELKMPLPPSKHTQDCSYFLHHMSTWAVNYSWYYVQRHVINIWGTWTRATQYCLHLCLHAATVYPHVHANNACTRL